MPPPDPRSSTVSPAFSCASAVGLPQPSEASSAASGICAASVWLYRSEVITSFCEEPQQEAVDFPVPTLPVLQQASPRPSSMVLAASPYFCRTISRTSSRSTSFTSSIFTILSCCYSQQLSGAVSPAPLESPR